MTAIGVALAAAVGGIVRLRLSVLGWRGTLTVNVAGSFLLGVLLGWRPDHDMVLILGTGFCGALTTFGTFALEASSGPPRLRALIVSSNVVGCLVAATIGYWIA